MEPVALFGDNHPDFGCLWYKHRSSLVITDMLFHCLLISLVAGGFLTSHGAIPLDSYSKVNLELTRCSQN